MELLSINNIRKKYGEKLVLDDISLEIEEGSIMSIIGPNGAGKTTLLNIIMGLMNYDYGSVFFKGEKIQIPYNKRTRTEISYIPDNPIFFDYLTGLENLMYLAEVFNKVVTQDELINIMKILEISENKDILFKNYSKGMKQKLMLLSIYISNSSLIVLDEPTNGLDPLTLDELKSILLTFKNMNKTILLATHDMGFCEAISDEFIILNKGSLVHIGKNDIVGTLQDFVVNKLKT